MRSAAFAVFLAWMLVPPADVRAQPMAERGPYVSVFVTAAEPDGPKPTTETSLELFSGYGLAGAVGYRWLPLRLELEYQWNTAYPIDSFLFGSEDADRIAVRSLMVNGYVEGQLNEWLGVFAGAGFGSAKVSVDISTCYQHAGCAASYGAHASGSASARQVTLGVTVGPFRGHQGVIGFRRLKTGALGLTDNLGQPFAADRAELKMSFFGWRGNF
jgi:opacity protein-like surface antigen